MELRLRFRNLTEHDQGIWKCFGVDEYGQSISQNFPIHLKSKILSSRKLFQSLLSFSANRIHW